MRLELLERYDTEAKRAVSLYRELSGDRGTVLRPCLELKNMGRIAGQQEGQTIRINPQLFDHGMKQVIQTVRHELAHWVTEEQRKDCNAPKRGRWASHGAHWRHVVVRLGGKADRCHTLDLEPTRKVRRFLYLLDSGKEVHLTTIRHNRVQYGGRTYRVRSTGETIRAGHYLRTLR